MENEIFGLKFNENGIRFLKKMHTWTTIFFIACIASSIFDMINAYSSIIYYQSLLKKSMELTPGFKARMLVNIIFLFIYAIILPIQAYFFYRFTSESNKGLRYENAEELNSSFKWLFRHAVFAAILFVLNSLWAMYLAQQEIRRLIHSA